MVQRKKKSVVYRAKIRPAVLQIVWTASLERIINFANSPCIFYPCENEYYYDRPRHTGDYHGQAAYMWCVNAPLEESGK